MAKSKSFTGVVQKLFNEKGFGFIEPDEPIEGVSKGLFFHINDLAGGEKVVPSGTKVSFQVGKDAKGRPCGIQVKVWDTKGPDTEPESEPPKSEPRLSVKKLSSMDSDGFYDLLIGVLSETGEPAGGSVWVRGLYDLGPLETRTNEGECSVITNVGVGSDGQWIGKLRLAGNPPPNFLSVRFQLIEKGQVVASCDVVLLSPENHKDKEQSDV